MIFSTKQELQINGCSKPFLMKKAGISNCFLYKISWLQHNLDRICPNKPEQACTNHEQKGKILIKGKGGQIEKVEVSKWVSRLEFLF